MPDRVSNVCLQSYVSGFQSVFRGSKRIRGYISVTVVLKFTYFFKLEKQGFVKNNRGNSLIGDMCFCMNFRISK